MRTKTLLLTAALSAAGLATSLAQSNVYSLNVVGYVNKVYETGPGKFVMIGNPLNATNNSLPNLFPTAPNNTIVYKWDAGGFFAAFGKVGGQWSAAGSNTFLNPGEGAFLSLAAVPAGTYTNTYVGEVLQGNLTNPAPAGFTLSASMVPQAGGLQSVLGYPVLNPGTLGSLIIYKWDVAGIQFVPKGYIAGTGWGGGTEPTVDVGEGFFSSRPAGSGTNWVRNFTVQ